MVISNKKTLTYIENNSIANNLKGRADIDYEPYISDIWEQIKEMHTKDGQSLITKIKSRAIFYYELDSTSIWYFLYGVTVGYDQKRETIKEAMDLLDKIDWGTEDDKEDTVTIENSGVSQILVTIKFKF